MRRYLPVAMAAFVAVAIDQLTKSWAVDRLGPYPGVDSIHVIGSLEWRLAYNSGMAFSRGQGKGLLIALVAIGIVAVLLWFVRSVEPLWGCIVIGVVIGGALGNLADRAFRPPAPGMPGGFMKGAVVDFIYLRWWPTFNVADSCVVVGGILLAILAFRMPDEPDDGLPDADGMADAGEDVVDPLGVDASGTNSG